MPDSFSDYIKVFDIDVNEEIYKILLKNEIQLEIIEYNQSQLQEGVDANEKKIITISAEEQNLGNVYSLFTIANRSEAGLQTRVVDLNYSGAFYRTFKVEVGKDSFKIFANYIKPDGDIRENFDSNYEFTGLTDDNLESFVWLVLYRELEKVLPKRLNTNASKYLN
jgi:hypothetical protein